MDRQLELELGDSAPRAKKRDLCPCGCGQTIAALNTNPTETGSRPYLSQAGLKIWLASWGCVKTAKLVLALSQPRLTFTSKRSHSLSI